MEKFYKSLGAQVLRVNGMSDEERRAMMAVSEHHRPDEQEEETVRQLYLQQTAADCSPGHMDRRKSLSSSALDQMLARTGDLANSSDSSQYPDVPGGDGHARKKDDKQKRKEKNGGTFSNDMHEEERLEVPTPPPRRVRDRGGGSTNSTPNAKVSKDVRECLFVSLATYIYIIRTVLRWPLSLRDPRLSKQRHFL